MLPFDDLVERPTMRTGLEESQSSKPRFAD
jgi:hypothetical protein